MGDFAPLLERNAVIPPWLPGQDNFQNWAHLVAGQMYGVGGLGLTLPGGREEEIENNFASYISHGLKGNGIVFSIMRDRMALFSQARFKYQSLIDETLNGNPTLGILEHPWANATTGDLLARAISDADNAGNHYATRRRTRTSDRIVRMRPDWVTMVHGTNDPNLSADDLDAEFLGIIYYPGGEYSPTGEPEYIQRSQIAHFAPIPDPMAHSRGMSWLTPVVREVMGDSAATSHKLRFFENGATPNLVVSRKDAPEKRAFLEWKDLIEKGHAGQANAYKTLYLTNGADATVVGADGTLDFKKIQGAGETRIAAAGGIHPAIAALSEGMQGASLNSGNFAAARRLVADKTMWWLWGNYCGSMETLVPPPEGSRLWVDASGIPFLREDRKDAAEIQQIKAQTIRTLTDGGYDPTSILKYIDSENVADLKWSGLVSVQLQPPGSSTKPEAPVTPPAKPTPGKTPPTGGAK